VIRYDRRV